MTSLRADGVPRKLALVTLAWAQLLAGTQQPVLSKVTNTLPHITPIKWIPSIREFLLSISGRMEVENLPATPLKREHDQFLMDIAIDLYSESYDPQLLNACRLHLQVTLLSDIITADGKFIQRLYSHINLSPTLPMNSSHTNLLQILLAGTSGALFFYISHAHLHTPLSNHVEDGFTPPMP